MYGSRANSGYSYKLSGLEKGTYTAYSKQPAPLGNCGLYIQFDTNSLYNNTSWTIEIPNKKSPNFVNNQNIYKLALTERNNKISASKDIFDLEEVNIQAMDAPPRTEEIISAEANIAKAQALIKKIEAKMDDQSIFAPFGGMVTNKDIYIGELATTKPVITILNESEFKLTARIPEIDITKIKIGQSADILFDAQIETHLNGVVTFISPLATEIDGVAYFEATITLNETPPWIKSGLNSDIDITVVKKENVLRLQKRFLIKNEDDSYAVFVDEETKKITKPVSPIFFGNNGYVEITGLTEGTTVIAP